MVAHGSRPDRSARCASPLARSDPMSSKLSRSWQQRASPLARLAFGFMCFVIAYASLYPFTGWRDTGISPFAFLDAPWPRYLTGFDIATNLLAYLPLGMLGVLALHPRLRGTPAVAASVLLCAALSVGMEAVQTFLPNRIASNLDFALNLAGALGGALVAAPVAPALLDRGRLRDLRLRLFERDASGGLLLVLLWFVAQLFPQAMLFGTGELVSLLHDLVDSVHGEPVRWELLHEITPEGFVVAEAVCAASALAGAALLLLQLARPHAPRLALLALFVLAAAGMRSFAAAVAFGVDDLLAWAAPGARLGLAAGFVIALAGSYAPAPVRRAFAIGLLTASVAAVNLVPENPYFAATMADWRQGQWINFNGLLRLVALAWPYLAIGHLLLRRPQERRL